MPDHLATLAPLIEAVLRKPGSVSHKTRLILHTIADQKRQEIYKSLGIRQSAEPRWVPKLPGVR
jgi:hypothetical protein